MACVEAAIPVPNSRKKTDELFLCWLSEPSTQELLRKELSSISGVPYSELEEKATNEPHMSVVSEYGGFLSPSSAVTNVLRPGSPNIRTPSPPPLTHRSPKSPRGAGRTNRSPKKVGGRSPNGRNQVIHSGLQQSFEEVDGEECVPSSSSNILNSQIRHQLETVHADSSELASRQRGKRSRSHSPKPESLPVGPGLNQGPKLGTNSTPIPRFYFPNGKPCPEENLQEIFAELAKWFEQTENGGKASFKQMPEILKILHVPFYWKAPFFKACLGKDKERETLTLHMVKKAWQRVTHNCHDQSSRFVRLLATNGRSYLVEEDLEVLVQDVVDSHPGLQFLSSTPEFHARYIETVIGRIFYVVDRNWNGRLSATEIRRSNLLQTLQQLEEEPDINQVTDFFSYEHFYVIYCKFWELDSDHDLEIDHQDLSKHTDHALTQRIIQRVMSGVVSRRSQGLRVDQESQNNKMGYKDFIWFLLSEEDKNNPRSIEYWFRCMDLDGDGVLSLFEMVYFYEEVLQQLQDMNIDCLSVENTVCQVLDIVNPKERGKISLRDLKSCKMTPVFFNTFVNINKYLDYEQRDPVATVTEEGAEGAELSDWDKYAAEQYELLLQEEQDNNEFDETEASDVELEDDEKEMLDFLR